MEIVNIRELIDRAGFSLIKGTVPTKEQLDNKDIILDDFYVEVDDIEEYAEQPCYLLTDRVRNRVRAIYLGDTFAGQDYFNVIDILGVFTDDLLFNDIIEDIIYRGYKLDKDKISDVSTLYKYVVDNNIYIGNDLTYLYALETGDSNYFQDLTD